MKLTWICCFERWTDFTGWCPECVLSDLWHPLEIQDYVLWTNTFLFHDHRQFPPSHTSLVFNSVNSHLNKGIEAKYKCFQYGMQILAHCLVCVKTFYRNAENVLLNFRLYWNLSAFFWGSWKSEFIRYWMPVGLLFSFLTKQVSVWFDCYLYRITV